MHLFVDNEIFENALSVVKSVPVSAVFGDKPKVGFTLCYWSRSAMLKALCSLEFLVSAVCGSQVTRNLEQYQGEAVVIRLALGLLTSRSLFIST